MMTKVRNAAMAAMIAVCLTLATALVVAPLSSAYAGASDPLFVNLTSDDAHRIDMALAFGGNQMRRGHPLTVFMNDKAVHAASKANGAKFPTQQKTMADLLAAGARILVCPMCMKHYGVAEGDLLPGLQVGSPEMTGQALFQDGTKTLTW